MSRAALRTAVAAWLTGRVQGLNTVYASWPNEIPEAAFMSGQPGDSSGAVAWLHIPTATETRKAMGGPTNGRKRIDHGFEIHVMFRSVIVGADIGVDRAVIAEARRDEILDGLAAAIRADRTAGSSDVWQWGEGVMTTSYGELTAHFGGLTGLSVVRTSVTEWLNS